MKVLPAFWRDAAWDIARLYMAWQYATNLMRGHHADKNESECNQHADDSHRLRRMDRHSIRPVAREPARGGWVHHSKQSVSREFLKGNSAACVVQHIPSFTDCCSQFILKKKKGYRIETVAPRWSVSPRMLFSRVQYLKRLLFAGLAFARVIVLNIRKPNGVCCPASSPRL